MAIIVWINLFEAFHSYVLAKSTIFIYWICPYYIHNLLKGSCALLNWKQSKFVYTTKVLHEKFIILINPIQNSPKKVYESSFNASWIILHQHRITCNIILENPTMAFVPIVWQIWQLPRHRTFMLALDFLCIKPKCLHNSSKEQLFVMVVLDVVL